jgi:methionyl-tRNA formyltransferase
VRVVFLGSPEFAVPSLEALAAHREISVELVVTQPDRPSGRGRLLTPPAVGLAAMRLGLPLYQPGSLREPDAAAQLLARRPHLLVVVAYGEILRQNVLELAPGGCINVHPSLLPKYRGAAPIPAAILSGDTTTGVSIIRLVRRMDAGPILAQQSLDIRDDDTTGSLSARVALLAAAMLPAVALLQVAGAIEPRLQNDRDASYTREWTVDDARIDWSQPAAHIARLVRAANPWPIAWTTLDGDRLRIIAAVVDSDVVNPAPPGDLHRVNRRVVAATGDGWLELLTVQASGRRPMPAADWWIGQRRSGARLGAEPER